MPRKKKESAEVESGQIARVICPACGSIVSADGRTLFTKSPALLDLEKTKEILPRLEEGVKTLEELSEQAEKRSREYAKQVEVLELQLKEANARTEKKGNVEDIRERSEQRGSGGRKDADADDW